MTPPIRLQSPMSCATARLTLARTVAAVKPTPLSAKIGAGVRTGYLTTVTGAEKHIGSVAAFQTIEALFTHPGRVTLDVLQSVAKSIASLPTKTPLPPSAFRQVGFAWNTTAGRLMVDAFTKGSREAWSAIRKGVDPETVGDAFDTRHVNFGHPLLQTAADYVNTFVTARNKPFWQMAMQGSLYTQAKALAIREGLSGEARVQRTNALLEHPTDQMSVAALAAAQKQVFSNQGWAAKVIAKGRQALVEGRDKPLTRSTRERASIQATTEGLIGDEHAERVHKLMSMQSSDFEQAVQVPRTVTGLAAKAQQSASRIAGAGVAGFDVTLPFARIGLNLAARAIDYTPAGYAKTLASALITRDPQVVRDGLTTNTIGTGLGLAAGYYLASQGRLTGAGNKEHPNQLKIGETWHNLGVFEPLGLLPSLGANYYEQQKAHPGAVAGNFARASGEQLKQITEGSFLASFQHVQEFLQAGPQIAQKAAALVPSVPIVSQVARGLDPYVRDTRDPNPLVSMGKTMAAGIPGVSRLVPPKLDAQGRPITRPEGLAGALLDPTRPKSSQKPRSLRKAAP